MVYLQRAVDTLERLVEEEWFLWVVGVDELFGSLQEHMRRVFPITIVIWFQVIMKVKAIESI